MKNRIKSIVFVLLMTFGTVVYAQNVFTKGVNLSNWFQASSLKQLQFTKFSKQDIKNIKSLGCDVIRFPINLHAMTNGAPNYTISPLFFQFLDSVVTWAEDLQIHLIIDNHTFDPNVNTPTNFDIPLRKEWIQMAQHYKNHSNNILYEILNEPHGPTTAVWGKMQKTVIDTIRTIDTKHTIIVGASNYNAYTEMKNIPVYTDTNLIYTFHFYDPFLFTHQGANWAKYMDSLSGVPYPYNAVKMPACPSNAKGTWVETELKKYNTTGTDSSVKKLIDFAIAFRNQRKVKIYCGEYGVYNLNSSNDDRIYWYTIVRQYLDANQIPWTTWDYQGSFGLFVKGSNEQFNYDLNMPLVKTLGFNEPAQFVYKKLPDSVGFPIYTDYVEKNVIENSWSDTAVLDLYCTKQPNNGTNSIQWKNPTQYSKMLFQFVYNKDLSQLKAENYAIDMMVRGDNPTATFEVRFIQKKTTDATSHPWRMSYTIDKSKVPMDKYWHHVRIPFSAMKETGAWDGTWLNANGEFDWTTIGQLEIVAEQKALPSTTLWFDNIIINNIDTAQVYDTTKLVEPLPTYSGIINGVVNEFTVSPNPANQQTTISYNLESNDDIDVSIYTILGQKVCTLVHTNQNAGTYSVNLLTSDYAPGMYICRLRSSNGISSIELLK